jgi:hypothetical protein
VTVIAADEGESRPRRHAVTAVGMEGFIFVLFCVSASLLCYSVVLLLLWSDRANAKKHIIMLSSVFGPFPVSVGRGTGEMTHE